MPVYGKTYKAFGEEHHLSEWSRKTGISIWTIKARLAHGWTIEKALSQPPVQRKARILYNGRYCTYAELATFSKVDVTPSAIRYRIAELHMDVRDAINTPLRGAVDSMSPKFHGRKPEACTYPDCDRCPFDDCYAG